MISTPNGLLRDMNAEFSQLTINLNFELKNFELKI